MSETPKRPEWELKRRGVLSVIGVIVVLCVLGFAILLALAGFIFYFPR